MTRAAQFVFVLPLLAVHANAQLPQFEGKPIEAIEFSPAQTVDASDLARVLPLKKGDALHAEKVAQAIDGLFATGRFDDIVVEVEPSGPGVRVRFVTKTVWFVGGVTVEGKVSVQPEHAQSAASTPIILTPGQQLVGRRDPKARFTNAIRRIDAVKVTGWREGQIFLPDLTLADAVDEMNKYSNVQIEVSDPTLRALKVHGVFRAGEQRAFVTAVQSYFPVIAEADGENRIVLKPR